MHKGVAKDDEARCSGVLRDDEDVTHSLFSRRIIADGSVSMSNTKASIGGAVRDSSEVWSMGFKMVTVVSNVFQIEAWAVVDGLKLIWSRGFKQVEVDCDNAMLIDTIQNGFA
ncbi:hypothetical protein J1N35_045648 [Gossypium stocksii]|uniref:RNase H type-1 domain-containing protein n=1 Tax=Gossypium stocksii TaxID=47602 RepID=A0A9D3UBH9_9ROSI|nr:hypothetical protein J1N35_045648 [Gossypium stocksii]